MAEKSRANKIFDKYLSKMSQIKKEKDAATFYQELKAGRNSYMRLDRLATSSFDMSWINAIEDVLFDLGDIVKNPRLVTKTESQLVPIELARKTNSESVRHLASHTQYIKTIDEDGNVIPNKVLNIASEDEIHTYENRFIATLIRRLVLFIEKRYEVIKQFASLGDEQILYFKNKSIINGAEVEIETKVKISAISDTSMADISDRYIERIKDMREYILYYYSSPFMKTMKTDRDVRNPIIMTNILRKNVKYHRCYELYRFLEKYQQLGVSYKVDEHASILSEEEMDELNTVSFTNYLALKDKERSRKLKSSSREYKPKILTSIDDEQFVYGDLLKGPFEFVRIDQPYQDYLDSKIKKDLPQHPTKIEREYYRDEYEERKINREDHVQLERLLKRKSKEALENEKRIQKIIEEREKEEELRRIREAEAARLEEERRYDEYRQRIIDAAKGVEPVEYSESNEPKDEKIKFMLDMDNKEGEEALFNIFNDSAKKERIKFDRVKLNLKDDLLVFKPSSNLSKLPFNKEISNENIGLVLSDGSNKESAALFDIFSNAINKDNVEFEPASLDLDDSSSLFLNQEALKDGFEKMKDSDINLDETPQAKEAYFSIFDDENKIEDVDFTPTELDLNDIEKDDEDFEIFSEDDNDESEKIPGRFIVKTPFGYFCENGEYSENKEDAKVFDDLNKANYVKEELGGEVIKL